MSWQDVDWSPERTRAWWRSWTASDHVSGAEFRVLARHTDGSCVALWLVDPDPPVVLLGADGTAALIAHSERDYRRDGVGPALPSDFAAYACRLHPAAAVRTAVPADAPDLQNLITTMGYEVSAPAVAERLARLPDGHAVLVAVTDRVVGWVHGLISYSLIVGVRAELGGLAVTEDAQGTGAGTALLAAAERWAARHGAQHMYVRSGSSRTAAHAFYAARGYTSVKTQLALTKPLRPLL